MQPKSRLTRANSYESMGPKALAEAAQKAQTHEKEGRKDDADTWRRIEAALRQMQGPHVS